MTASDHIERAEAALANVHQAETANERLTIALLAIGHALVASAKKPSPISIGM